MKPKRVQIHLLVASLLSGLAGAADPRVPVPVAPGSLDGESLLAGSCPSFHWAGVEGAASYELVVYAADEGAGSEPVLSVKVPGSATSWAPSRDSCFDGGGRYAWSVRALRGAGGESWSPPAVFEVAGAPSLEEVERALEVLRRYREEKGAPRASEGTASGAATRSWKSEVLGGATHSRETVRPSAREIRERRAGRSGSGDKAFREARVGRELEDSTGAGRAAGRAATRAPAASTTPSLTVDDQIHLGENSNVFREGESFLWTDVSANLALGARALSSAFGAVGNHAVGFDALADNVGGDFNSAFGLNAMRSNSSGSSNSGFGADALADNETGSSNSAFGRQALRRNTTGSSNSAFGSRALEYSYGENNSAFGASALQRNKPGTDNGAFGALALRNNSYGDRNSAFGAKALYGNTDGSSNSAFGFKALYGNDYGSANSAFGSRALYSNNTYYADANTAVGHDALRSNTVASNNTAIGQAALRSNTSGSENTAVGQEALRYNTTGNRNTAVGEDALKFLKTGNNNVAVGRLSGFFLSSNQSDNVLILNTGSGVQAGFPEIRVGTQGTQVRTRIAGIAGVALGGGANVVVEPDGRLGVSASSERFKEAIRDMGEVGEKLAKLRPVRFRYRDGPGVASPEASRDRLEYGLIAEEVAKVLPELVALDARGEPYAVRYDLLSALLLQELRRVTSENRAVDLVQARRLAAQRRDIEALAAGRCAEVSTRK